MRSVRAFLALSVLGCLSGSPLATFAAPTADTRPAPAAPLPFPPDITVAADGSGNFTTIQQALDSIPKDNTQRIVILVKDGTYQEKIRVDPSFVTIRGQSRAGTHLEFSQVYGDWQGHRDDIGRAVVNLGPVVPQNLPPATNPAPAFPTGSDCVLQNITVKNTSGVHNHSFALYTETADRLVITDSDILGTGGDTLAPMNINQGPAGGGRYYFARLDVHGAVDFVCPKGWCYMCDSHLFEEISDASTWHNGSALKSMKFVLKNISFEGVDRFNLGRHHVAANMYYIDCTFGKNIADRAPYLVRYPKNKPQEEINDKQNPWGERIYFYNDHRVGGDEFAWMKNNLDTAEGSPKPEQITAAWTFDNTWDPETKTRPTIKAIAWKAADHKIAVTFSESVTVKGRPRMELQQGPAAGYASGSGTNTLMFDTADNAPVPVKSVDLNGGFILATMATADFRMAQLDMPK